jgi:hypothetical protein
VFTKVDDLSFIARHSSPCRLSPWARTSSGSLSTAGAKELATPPAIKTQAAVFALIIAAARSIWMSVIQWTSRASSLFK